MAGYIHAFRHFRRDVRLLLISLAAFGFGYFGIYVLLLNLYLLRLGYGPEFLGLVNSIGPLGFAVFSLYTGAVSRRWGYRLALAVGAGLEMAGLALLPFAEFMPSGWQAGWLLATSLLAWLGGALYVATGNPFLMSVTTDRDRDHAFALQSAFLPVAGFVGNLVGGLLPDFFARLLALPLERPEPYRYALWIGAALLLPAIFALLAIGKSEGEVGETQVAATGRPPYGPILLITLVMLCRTGSEWVVRIFFNAYLDASLEVPTVMIGVLFAAAQLLGLVALVSPTVVTRFGRQRIIILAMVGQAISILPLALIPHWTAAGLSFMGVVGLISLATPAYFVLSQQIVPLPWRATMSGAVTMAIGLSIGGMSLGGGYLVTAMGYRNLFLLGAVLALVGALLFAAYFRVPRGEFAPAISSSIDEPGVF